eukprot:1871262-Prymnesium_polylepis.1
MQPPVVASCSTRHPRARTGPGRRRRTTRGPHRTGSAPSKSARSRSLGGDPRARRLPLCAESAERRDTEEVGGRLPSVVLVDVGLAACDTPASSTLTDAAPRLRTLERAPRTRL